MADTSRDMAPIVVKESEATAWETKTVGYSADSIRLLFGGDPDGLVMGMLGRIEALQAKLAAAEAEVARLRESVALAQVAAVEWMKTAERAEAEVERLKAAALPATKPCIDCDKPMTDLRYDICEPCEDAFLALAWEWKS
jgi:hypothetical protein